jgi:hypothetical protein
VFSDCESGRPMNRVKAGFLLLGRIQVCLPELRQRRPLLNFQTNIFCRSSRQILQVSGGCRALGY